QTEELARIARLVNETLDLTTVSERIAESVLGLLRAHSSAIRLLQPDGSLQAIALGGRIQGNAPSRDRLPPGVGLVGRAAAEGRPMWSADVRADARFQLNRELRERNVEVGIVAGLAVPLRVVGKVIGVPRAIVNLFDLAAGEVEWLAAAGRHRIRVGPGVRYSLELMGDVEALKRGEMQVIDVDALPPSPETDALLASGVHVYMVVPMIAGG